MMRPQRDRGSRSRDVRLHQDAALVTQPDILVVPSGHLADKTNYVTELLLAVEVISPSSFRKS